MLLGRVEILRLFGPRFVVSFAPNGIDEVSARGSRTCDELETLRDTLTRLGITGDLQAVALGQIETGIHASIPNLRLDPALLQHCRMR